MNRKELAALTIGLRDKAWNAQEGRCLWCDIFMLKRKSEWRAKPNQRVTADHLIPASKGGESVIGNIIAACSRCNHRRRDRTVEQWVLMLKQEYSEAQFALLLSKLTRFGIELLNIGHPAQAAPTVENPIVRAPEEDATAPA